MTSGRLLTALFAISLLGCTSGPCGEGEPAGAFCAYPSAIVIEGGFSCPASLPVRFDFGDAAFCGPDGSTLAEAEDACADAGFDCGPPSCRQAPDREDCVPGPGSCDVPRRFGYPTEAAAEASCEGECAICPHHVVGEITVTWMVIEVADCPCPIPTELGELSCYDADMEASRQRALLWSDPNACTADSDCVIAFDTDTTCEAENAYLGACPYVVHRDSLNELALVNEAVAARVCPRVPRDCMSGPVCVPVEPRCVAFACRGVDTYSAGTCLEGCEALGCGDCAARCIADRVCVAAASSCAAVEACASSPLGPLVMARPYDEGASCLEPQRAVGIIEPLSTASGDLTCGVGPDGRAYVFASGSLRDALGWPDCDAAVSAAALGADDC